MADEKNLIQKIAAVSLEVGSLRADKTNSSQNYDYISADKILSVAGKKLAAAGIVIRAYIEEDSVEAVQYTNSYGKTNTRWDARIAFTMIVSDGGNYQIEDKWIGRGNDSATPDKAHYKALTSGHKYYLMKLLNISVGNEDGEHEPAEEPAAEADAHNAPQPQKTGQGASKAQNTSNSANAKKNAPETGNSEPVDMGNVEPPTDEELDVIGRWESKADAINWALAVGAVDNEHAAGNAWMAIVRQCRGFSPKNAAVVYLLFYRDRAAKLQQILDNAED